MSIEARRILGGQEEQVAVVTIAIPAGGEVEIDRTWRFEGWLLKRKAWQGGQRLKVEEPFRHIVEVDDDDGDG